MSIHTEATLYVHVHAHTQRKRKKRKKEINTVGNRDIAQRVQLLAANLDYLSSISVSHNRSK